MYIFYPFLLTPHAGRKVHNRWLLAYTLIRNPSLVPRKPTDQSVKVNEPEKLTSTSGLCGSCSSDSHDSNQILDCESPAAVIMHHPGTGNRDNSCTLVTVEDTSCISETAGGQCALAVIVCDNEILTNSEPLSCLTTDRCEEECEPATVEVESSQSPVVTKTDLPKITTECNPSHVSESHDGEAKVEIVEPNTKSSNSKPDIEGGLDPEL